MQRPSSLRLTAAAVLSLTLLACGGAEPSLDDDGDEDVASTGIDDDDPEPTSTTGQDDPPPPATGTGSTGQPDDDSTGGDTDDESGSDESGEVACELDVIELPGEAFYPEGVAADVDGTVYVASLATGMVVAADPCDGTITELVPAGGPLLNPVGIVVDATHDALVVCNSDFSFATLPSIDWISLADGSVLASHAFDAPGFCNDLTIDGEGNVYATDSAGARILRVAGIDRMSDTPAETWATDPDFEVGPGEFGLNGIAFDGDDGIYVVNYQQGELHRVAIEAGGDAGAVVPIAVGEAGLAGPDGLEWLGDGALLVAEGGLGAVSRIEVDGAAATVSVVQDGFDIPTTTTEPREGSVWVSEGQLDHLLGYDPAPPQVPFVVTRLSL